MYLNTCVYALKSHELHCLSNKFQVPFAVFYHGLDVSIEYDPSILLLTFGLSASSYNNIFKS